MFAPSEAHCAKVARNFTGKLKLEVGGGQSTVWWAGRARGFDVVMIDGLDRRLLVPLACELLAEGGVIICDEAEGDGFHGALKGRGLSRVDFYGHASGVLPPRSTSINFRGGAWVFEHDAAPTRVECGW